MEVTAIIVTVRSFSLVSLELNLHPQVKCCFFQLLVAFRVVCPNAFVCVEFFFFIVVLIRWSEAGIIAPAAGPWAGSINEFRARRSPNATELSACVAAIDHFKNFTDNCTSQKSPSSACDCWDADNATSKVMAELRACDLKELSNNHTSAVKSCKSAFGKCRKYEDDVGDAIHACNQDPDALKKKLKNLSVNKAEMDKILSTMSSALRSLRSAPANRVSFPGTRQATATSFLLVVTQITVLVSQNPVSYSIFTLAVTISTVSVSFSSADMAQLTSLEASMSAAVTTMESEISVVSTTITSLTGEVLTDADIDNLDVCESDAECSGDVAGTTVEPTTTSQAPPSATPTTYYNRINHRSCRNNHRTF